MSSVFGSGIKSKQHIVGTIAATNTGTTVQETTVTISSVVAAKSVILPVILGINASVLFITNIEITDATSVKINWLSTTTSTLRYSFQILEYN